jgi:hypothetical protein
LEAIINTVLIKVFEETEQGDNEKASSKTENDENAWKSKSSKRKKEKTKNIDPGFVKLLNNYHKAIWAAKYNSVLIRENEVDVVEVCEMASLLILLILIDFHKSIKSNWKCRRL